MERNLLLAVVLSLGVYVAWFAFMERTAPQHIPPAAGAPQTPAARSASGPAASPSPALDAAKAPAPESLLRLPAPNAEAGLNPRGGGLASYRFQGPLGAVELVPQGLHGFFSTWPELEFQPAASNAPDRAALEAAHPGGFIVRKEFRFPRPGELYLMRVEFKNPGKKPLDVPPWEFNIGPGLGTVVSEEKENLGTMRAVGLLPPPQGRKQPRLETLDAGEPVKDWQWLAIDNRYFILAAFPERKEFTGGELSHGADGKTPGIKVTAGGETLAPGAVSSHDIPFYLGPKDYRLLEEMKLGLEKAVDFGWFDWVGRRLLKLMRYLKERTGNYGWAIILLTVLLQIALFPLTLKSIRSAAAMRRIQPEVTRLQQRYSKDPQRMNQELMGLYRTKGANPMGGCLPMLLQLPIFVALFNTLRNAWELHGSPWFGWIHDLSAKDPYYVLPLIMGGVMYFQNKLMQMPAADPMQAKMMQFMPVIFTFMFLNFPSGLVLYWLTSSVINTGVQLALKGPEPAS